MLVFVAIACTGFEEQMYMRKGDTKNCYEIRMETIAAW